ncbi:hypothetical protein JOF53_002268 [Crossiella equi]|uniref:Helix-turn-helix domain-containing protein n=1 Tax=Crossiella equi TaxID=130796 RepID=A0ABS5AA03_9PSEU|nr:hypothetical protein [Crossiella equi]MBP2473396.1 hypothetical protein [Crossiella equi]
MTEHNPFLAEWLAGHLPPSALDLDQLTLMLLLSEREGATPFPERVLDAWRTVLLLERERVEQSELRFIDRARRQGWSWARLAEELGLSDAETAERRREELAEGLTRKRGRPELWRHRYLEGWQHGQPVG